jgi:hypothetical protein
MRSSLAAVAVAVAAATLAGGCGGGGGDDEKAGGDTTTTTTREAVDVSTPEAVVAALADAGISCDNLVSEGSEGLALFDIEGTESNCTIGGDTLSIAIVASDDELSNVHALLTDLVGFVTDDAGQPIGKIMWVEVDHTVVNFENSLPTDATRLAQIQGALGGRIESVSAVDQPA